MLKSLKKIILCLAVSLLFSFSVYASPAENVKEYTLENGLKIFLLEDSTDTLVHLNFVSKSGFSSQTQETNGFFKLFTRLVKASTPQLNYSSIQCNADSSIYSLSFAPAQTDSVLQDLSSIVFNSNFADEVFTTELNKLKNEVSENAETMSTYINAAIDSRVFSDAPWKHDSGIYPPLFKKTSEKTARNAIAEIADRWYIPKNCGIFIYGNINSEKLLISIKNTFGRYYSNYSTPVEKTSAPVNKQRKYVFHNEEISSDLTQVVVQYTMLNPEQADLMAATLNNDNSTFKRAVLGKEELNIPGAEYIDVSSAYKKNSSRLIIQTLLQAPENKKIKTNALEQAKTFAEAVENCFIYPEEFQFAKKQLIANYNYQASTPYMLMEKLTAFWPLQEYYSVSEDDFNAYPDSPTMSLLNSRNSYLNNTDLTETLRTLNSESPFVFVIINSKIYKNNKKAFADAGYEEINSENSSWYVQEMFKNIKDQFKPEDIASYKVSSINAGDNYYYAKNIEQIESTELSNGIKVISKKNDNSTGISLALSISGGKLNSADNHGFEEVMVNLMSVLIQKELYNKAAQGIILEIPQVTTKTDISTSTILINFEKEDSKEVCSAIANAIIYGEIAPADADRAVSARQYKKRLENGSSASQMLCAALKSVYGRKKIAAIFDTEKDILTQTDYNTILSNYPALLDADRFTLILTGNFEQEIFEYLEQTFQQLSKNGYARTIETETSGLSRSKSVTVKIRHTFLTDIPAEKAGPQPAVLIPTTEFLDPVIYMGTAPEAGTREAAIYNAMLNYLGNQLQTAINDSSTLSNSTVTVQLPQSHIELGIITVSNVAHTKELDALYKTTIQKINNDLLSVQAKQNIVQNIKNLWSLDQMAETASNGGTALLLQKGLELLPEDIKPEFYLEEYNSIQNATVQDYIDIMSYFPTKAQLRVYSADGKN